MTILSRTAIVEICEDLEFYGFDSIAQEIKEHDTAQREALLRVEAERDEYAKVTTDSLNIFRQCATERDAAQAQLAEAVELLKALDGNPSYADHVRADAFIARHAQAAHSDEY